MMLTSDKLEAKDETIQATRFIEDKIDFNDPRDKYVMSFKLYSLIVMIEMMIMLMIIFLSMIINDADVSDDDDDDVDCI